MAASEKPDYLRKLDRGFGLLGHRDAMLIKPVYIGSLVTRDASHGAIFLEMSATSSDSMDAIRLDPNGGDGLDNLYPQVSNNRVVETLARPEYAGIEFWWSGDTSMNAAYNETINDESALLAFGVDNVAADNPLRIYDDENYLQLELGYYF